jgi:hypothetical protein
MKLSIALFTAGCSHDFLEDCPADLLSADKSECICASSLFENHELTTLSWPNLLTETCQSAGFARVTLPGASRSVLRSNGNTNDAGFQDTHGNR